MTVQPRLEMKDAVEVKDSVEKDLVALLDQKEEHSLLREEVVVPAAQFSVVNHLASLLAERKLSELDLLQENQEVGLALLYLCQEVRPSQAQQLLAQPAAPLRLALEEVVLRLDLPVVLDMGSTIPQNLSTVGRFLQQGMMSAMDNTPDAAVTTPAVPEATPAKLEKIRAADSRTADPPPLRAYQTALGQFLPADIPALLAAATLTPYLQRLEPRLQYLSTIADLHSLMVTTAALQSVANKKQKKRLKTLLQDPQTSLDEGMMLALVTLADTKGKYQPSTYWSRLQRYNSQRQERPALLREFKREALRLQREKMTYAQAAKVLWQDCVKQFGYKLPPEPVITTEQEYKQFKETLIENVVENLRTKGEIDTTPLRVGETVELVANCNLPGHSGTRSWGYVVNKDNGKVEVKFEEISCEGGNNCYNQDNGVYLQGELLQRKGQPQPALSPLEQFLCAAPKEVGDMVRIHPQSRFSKQHQGEGEVIEVSTFDFELPYLVQFQDGTKDRYEAEDLQFGDVPARLQGKIPEGQELLKKVREEQVRQARQKIEARAQEEEEPVQRYRARRQGFIMKYQHQFRKMAIAKEVISYLFHSQAKDLLEESEALPPSFLEQINDLQAGVSLEERAKVLVRKIRETTGIIILPPRVETKGEYTTLITYLPRLALEGYRISDKPIAVGGEAMILNHPGLAAGTVVNIGSRCVDHWHVHNRSKKDDEYHAAEGQLQSLEKIFPGLVTPLEAGMEVLFLQSFRQDWNEIYFLDRDKNFPLGSKGKVVKKSPTGWVVQFPPAQPLQWNRNWGDHYMNVAKAQAEFKNEELKTIIPEELQTPYRQEEQKMKTVLQPLVEAVERIDTGAFSKRRLLAKKAIQELYSLGYERQEIFDLFQSEISYQQDLQDAGLLPKD